MDLGGGGGGVLGRSEDREYENENTLIRQYVIYLFLPSHIFPLNKRLSL